MESKIYKIFIASPSDTIQEREICDKVFSEISYGIGNIYNFRIESLKWENDVRPSIQNKDGQSIINEQIGSSYDIFIGIMNKKFGSPTLNAGSGTEEEFNNAFLRYQEKKDVEVVFYFNDEPPKLMSELNPEELVKIQNFKLKLKGLGIYGTYNGTFNFEEKLRKHLTKYFIDEHKKKSNISFTEGSLNSINKETLRKIFNKRLNDSLQGFDDQPKVWIVPIISRTSEISQNPDENYNQRIHIEEILNSDSSYIIKAPAQFGLTSLGNYLVKEAWENDELWIFLDNNNTKTKTINNAVKNEVESLEQKLSDVKCIVFDSWTSNDNASLKKLKFLCSANKDTRIIVLHSIDDSIFLKCEEEDKEKIEIERVFNPLYLLALPRNQIRQVVSQYNKEKKINDDDDKVLTKILSDLECLNIHRTPYNCLTLLKVSEKYYDDSPINRTKMIEMILFVLFDMGEIPRYKTKPDLKDCEYVLGRFTEIMIKKGCYEFSRESFIKELKSFCDEKYIDLDVDIVFDVLFKNNIIVNKYGVFGFRSTFWIFYFGAKRMHTDDLFKKFIFESKKYAAFPEIIEFYTGIDRNKDDALEILYDDIKTTCDTVYNKIGIADNINPLALAKWKPTEESIEKINAEMSESVLNSKLPDAVKDKYLDKQYNQIRPYNQTISQIFEEYSLHNLMQQIRASSTALRNSDYANPEIKKQLLKEIYRSWEQLSKVLFALAPIMASKGEAAFEGAAFELLGDFGSTFEEKLSIIIQVIPTNVVGFFKDDLYSPKLGPLFFENFRNENNSLLKHHQALLLIFKRPRNWKKEIENYIISLNKNSFFLFNIVNTLRTKYRYDFASDDELKEISYLTKMGLAKHEFGGSKPGLHQIVKIADSNLPKREIID